MVYEGSGGNVLYEYEGGPIDDNQEFTSFGQGTQAQVSPSGLNIVNGVTLFRAAGGAAENSVGLATPLAWRGTVDDVDGVKRPACGPLVAKLRLGFPAESGLSFFFGILDEAPGDSRKVSQILDAAANGGITSVEDNFAGFYRDTIIAEKADYWRCVAINSGGGDKNGAKAPVLTNARIDPNAAFMNSTPTRSPTLSVEVTSDGTVEFYHNGVLVRRAFQGVDPEQNYCALFALETNNTTLKQVAIDYFCAEFARYYGPIFA